jgi:EAL domain-containing protein (putative c-di-GMP-specific phosphodiesterase class I)
MTLGLFISHLEESHKDRAILSAITGVANALSLKVIAEGVETVGQVNISNQCTELYYQGYYFYRPMPAADLLEVMKTAAVQRPKAKSNKTNTL